MKRTGKASGLEAARFQTAVAWVLVSLQRVCVAMSMSDLMVCEGRAFRRCLGHKDRALMNGVITCMRRWRAGFLFLCSLLCEDTKRRWLSVNREVELYQRVGLPTH